jgi:hypothetical protein
VGVGVGLVDAESARDRVKSGPVGILRMSNAHGIELVTDEVAPFRREYRHASESARMRTTPTRSSR